MDTTTRTIDRALTLARAKGWNQSQFAAEMGVSPQDMSNWKKRGMPPEHLAAVATVLRCSTDELLGIPQKVDTHLGDYGVFPATDVLRLHHQQSTGEM